MNTDGTSVFDTLKTFIEDTNESFKHWTVEDIKAFKNHIIMQLTPLQMIFSKYPKLPLSGVFRKMNEILKSDDNSVIDLIKGLGQLMVVFADNQEKFLAISEDKRYEDKDFEMLSKLEQNNIASLFGYDGKNDFEKDSILDGLYSLFNDPENPANKPINDLLLSPDNALFQLSKGYSESIHESLLQYAVDKNYWKILSKSFKTECAITGKASLGAKVKYSIEYNGQGDKTVTKFLANPIELPNDFNSVIPW